MKQKVVPICPKCASINLKSFYLTSPVELTRHGSKKFEEQSKKYPIGAFLLGWNPQNMSVYICEDCDYYGICPEIEKDKIKDFKKFIKNRDKSSIKKKN